MVDEARICPAWGGMGVQTGPHRVVRAIKQSLLTRRFLSLCESTYRHANNSYHCLYENDTQLFSRKLTNSLLSQFIFSIFLVFFPPRNLHGCRIGSGFCLLLPLCIILKSSHGFQKGKKLNFFFSLFFSLVSKAARRKRKVASLDRFLFISNHLVKLLCLAKSMAEVRPELSRWICLLHAAPDVAGMFWLRCISSLLS